MNRLEVHGGDCIRSHGDLYLGFELGEKKWKLGFTVGFAQGPRERRIIAGDMAAVMTEIGRAKERFGLCADTLVMSCYEAGREGFWLHRYLTEIGVRNVVVDSASSEVNRRARRAETDRMDVRKLLRDADGVSERGEASVQRGEGADGGAGGQQAASSGVEGTEG